MKKALFILLIIFDFGSTSIDPWINKLVTDLKPRQVTLYTEFSTFNDTGFNVSQLSILKSLISQVPTVAVDINNIPPFLNYTKKDRFLYNIKISASLHFFILNEYNVKEQFPRFYHKINFLFGKNKVFSCILSIR